MTKLLPLMFLILSSCAAYQRAEKAAWYKHGACATICDYEQNYMSTSYTLNPTQCRCYTPQLRDFNEGRLIKLDSPEGVITCEPDCKTVAAKICARQPWRCPYPTSELR